MVNLDAMILAGGEGTRLQPLIDDRPKPMALVAGRPFLEWIILQLKTQGIGRIVLCIGYMGNMIEAYFKDGRAWGLEIEYATEHELLGTAGAIRNGLDSIHTPQMLVLNGDSFTDFSLEHFKHFHELHNGIISMLLIREQNRGRFGAVDVNRKGEILGFQEKAVSKHEGFINAGVYLMERDWIKMLPVNQPLSLEKQVFPNLVGAGLWGFATDGELLDIGTPESFKQADAFIRDAVESLEMEDASY